MKDNPQFLRTDKAIRQALITLLKNKPFEKITVQDILDETPVTRSTFYKHYHDKYEIVEKMQEEFLASQSILSKEFHANPTTGFMTLQKKLHEHHEIMETLLRVHTEKVNLREELAKYSEEYYLTRSNHPDKYIQAKVFSRMMTEFQITEQSMEHATLEYMHDTIISVMFMALGISEDAELREYIKSKRTP